MSSRTTLFAIRILAILFVGGAMFFLLAGTARAGITGLTSATVGQTATYQASADDPDCGAYPEQLTFSFTFEDDGSTQSGGSTTCSESGMIISAPVLHTWNTAGTWNVQVTVTDVHGLSDAQNMLVIVGGAGSLPLGNAPSAVNLSLTPGATCVSPLQPIFSWLFTDPDAGDDQTAYRLQINDGSVFDSGKIISSSSSFAAPTGILQFDKTYTWQVRVWDSSDGASSWATGPQFSTQEHAAPDPDFGWSPSNPAIDQSVQFSDQTQFFGGTAGQSYGWNFQDGVPASSITQNPQSQFISSGTKAVTLAVTDTDGLRCSTIKGVGVSDTNPEFREIIPE